MQEAGLSSMGFIFNFFLFFLYVGQNMFKIMFFLNACYPHCIQLKNETPFCSRTLSIFAV